MSRFCFTISRKRVVFISPIRGGMRVSGVVDLGDSCFYVNN